MTMKNLVQHIQPPRQTPPTQPIPNTNQVRNAHGGYVWPVDDWTKLHRFLILGTEGGTAYVGERQHTIDNAQAVLRCIKADGRTVVEEITGVSTNGLAPKNEPALFALALCCAHGDTDTRRYAFEALPHVARTGTHLFQFIEAASAMRGWGRLMRHGIENWYQSKSTRDLVYQLVKYRQRGGWSHRDVLRHVRPTPRAPLEAAIYRWAVDGLSRPHEKDTANARRNYELLAGWVVGASEVTPDELMLIRAFEEATAATTNLPSHIRQHRLTHEMLPTEVLGRADVWQALLESMPLGAVVRNLGRMTANGAVRNGTHEARRIVQMLTDEARVRGARLHPLALVEASKIYAQGRGEKGSLTWSPIPAIVNALETAIDLSFGVLPPASGKRVLLGLDTSGSMMAPAKGVKAAMSCREAGTIMALAVAKSEPDATIVGFHTEHFPLDISFRDRYQTAMATVRNAPSGGTDCSLPIRYALDNGLEIDAFIILTDEENWAGRMHPVEALQEYRRLTGIQAKMIAVGMQAVGYSVVWPDDAGCLALVGMDTSVPQIINSFLSD